MCNPLHYRRYRPIEYRKPFVIVYTGNGNGEGDKYNFEDMEDLKTILKSYPCGLICELVFRSLPRNGLTIKKQRALIFKRWFAIIGCRRYTIPKITMPSL